MKKKLVILTTHFGTNFSGGSTATCEIFSRLETKFDEVIVIGNQLGEHPFSSLTFIKYSNWFQAVKKIREIKSDALFYGDFYNAFLFLLADVSFYFTYHDNWPELSKLGFANRLRSVFYTNIYEAIFRKAVITITVSQFKLNYVRQHTSRAALIYNGFSHVHQLEINHADERKKKIIMVGNIDERKYSLAVKLFKQLSLSQETSIHIYGNINDVQVYESLTKFSFVEVKGFVSAIPYGSYDLLLHTSLMENLPIIFCEALFHSVPVLAFDVGGSSEIIDDDSGVLIPPYDLDLMAHQLNELLYTAEEREPNPESLEKHSWQKASERYFELLST